LTIADTTPCVALDTFHHYCKGRVATQFCSFRREKDQQRPEWMALHEDGHFDCFEKLCAAADHFQGEHFKGWRFGGPEFVNVEFYYLVMVLEGELLEVRPTRSSIQLAPKPHLQFRRSQFANGKVKNYQIDVIQESFMPMYLRLVKNEGLAIVSLLRRRHKEVRHALEIIVRRARRLRSPDKIRKAFEYHGLI
jgi:hypothetical protein